MGHVKYPQDAINEGQSQGNQGVNGAHGDAVEELFQKELHGCLNALYKVPGRILGPSSLKKSGRSIYRQPKREFRPYGGKTDEIS